MSRQDPWRSPTLGSEFSPEELDPSVRQLTRLSLEESSLKALGYGSSSGCQVDAFVIRSTQNRTLGRHAQNLSIAMTKKCATGGGMKLINCSFLYVFLASHLGATKQGRQGCFLLR